MRGTVRSKADWSRTLEEVRVAGRAISRDESYDGVTSIAVPILVHDRAVASVSVFGASAEIEPDLHRLEPLLRAAVMRIAARLR